MTVERSSVVQLLDDVVTHLVLAPLRLWLQSMRIQQLLLPVHLGLPPVAVVTVVLLGQVEAVLNQLRALVLPMMARCHLRQWNCQGVLMLLLHLSVGLGGRHLGLPLG